jgi:hypothetical protein
MKKYYVLPISGQLQVILLAAAVFLLGTSCKKYLDIVPDNIATIDNAFTLQSTAERYLVTCYSFLPRESDLPYSTLLSGDELWLPIDPLPTYEFVADECWGIALGRQNVNTPLLDYWNGFLGISGLWEGIRDCNIFLEHIMNVPGMTDIQKRQWAAEAKFLKAYYHFYLLRMYGPIPIIKTNLPISASIDEVKVQRQPVDSVFHYIVQLLDEAAADLPLVIKDENQELGRATRPMALTLKAKVLVYEASPLFNGNPDYAGFTNKDGTKLFDPQFSPQKWKDAALACKAAIDVCESAGNTLYHFQPTVQTQHLSDETMTELNIRNIITERWNSEIIWANPNSTTVYLQRQATPFALDPAAKANALPRGNLSVPLNIASLFYTKHGVPIDEDKTWDYANRYSLRTATDADKHEIANNYVTAAFNFDREPRFYADLGFDGGIWYGQGVYDDDKNDNWVVEAKVGQTQGRQGVTLFPITGYYAKKYVYYTNVMSTSSNVYSMYDYPWVKLRLGDLYLLYAEALNEVGGPSQQVYQYLDSIRARAGLAGVADSWRLYSKFPDKYKTQDGLREIIHRERTIEMAFEGQRFWDERRWKTAVQTYNNPITGWDASQENASAYYRAKVLYNQSFSLRDYFWPLRQKDITVNDLLVQNPGW